MLVLEELVCQRDERALFAPLDEAIDGGECVALIGANGSGKTTLLRTLAGLYGQYTGRFDCSDFLYQGHRIGLDELLNPVQNLRWFGALHGRRLDDEALRAALSRVGMLPLALTPCQRLSQGQQRRVAMARWILSDLKLWLLDEPLTALDQQGQVLLNELIADHLATGGGVFCATHTPLSESSRQVHLQPAAEVS